LRAKWQQGSRDQLASKSEARAKHPEGINPKFETISNDQISNDRNKREFKKFEFRRFGFVSDWSLTDASPDIRISNF
jgi:hypothetical protein